jgi:hypothetical protein
MRFYDDNVHFRIPIICGKKTGITLTHLPAKAILSPTLYIQHLLKGFSGMTLPIKVVSLVAILAAALTAKADTLDFTLTGGGSTFTFSLPSNPSPGSSINGTSFTLDNILVTEGLFTFSTDLKFSNLTAGGGLDFSIPAAPPAPGTDLDLVGPQLYSGPEASPIFSATSTPFILSTPKGSDDFTLAIVDTSVPEPASIGLLATGLLALAGTARRKYLAR